MRLSLALLTALLSSSLACGGIVSMDPDGDGGAEGTDPWSDGGRLPDGGRWHDGSAVPDGDFVPDGDLVVDGDDPLPPGGDPLTDGGPWSDGSVVGCGVGACGVGTSCWSGCTECYCGSDGRWSCTSHCDTGTYPAPDSTPPASCPTWLPAAGSWCPGPLKCAYSSACGGTDIAACAYGGSRWTVSTGACGSCPASLPTSGSYCTGASKCPYPNSCGGTDLAVCDTSTSRWSVSIGSCPSADCPSTPPYDFSACGSTWMSCAWSNGCGGTKNAYCEGGRWSVTNSGCVDAGT